MKATKARSDEATKEKPTRTGTLSLRRSVAPSLRRSAHTGFSFAEVMFAVIVLGIGFIMIAAIFPVAIGQTQASLSDTAGVTTGRTGSIYIQQLLSEPAVGAIPPPYGDVTTYAAIPPGGDGLIHAIDGTGTLGAPTRWDRLKGNFINTADPRFAWIPIGYKMGDESAGSFGDARTPRYAEVYVLAVQSQSKPTFDRTDYDPPATPGSAPFDQPNLRPRAILAVHIQDNNPAYGTDTVTLPAGDPHTPCVGTGTYILIANDHLDTSATPANAKLMNGQYYRVGNELAPNIWELQPGADFAISPGADGVLGTGDDISDIPAADVFVVGKGYDNTSTPTRYEGPAMDLFMLPPIVVPLPLPVAP